MHKETWLPYEKRKKYPHLRPYDVEIWERFIDQFPDRFTRVMYDVHLAGEHCEQEDIGEGAKRAWENLTSWEIDILAEDPHAIYVIEAKPQANAKAIGQALSYAFLYQQDRQPDKVVIPVVLTDVAISPTYRVAQKFGVKIWQV